MIIYAIKSLQAAVRTGMVLTCAAFVGILLQPFAGHYTLHQATLVSGILFAVTAVMLYALACLPCPACRKPFIGAGQTADPFTTCCHHCGESHGNKKGMPVSAS